jgi:hypothetical protein
MTYAVDEYRLLPLLLVYVLAPIDDLVSEPARVSVRLSAQGIMNILE